MRLSRGGTAFDQSNRPTAASQADEDPIVIGLVNNMPDAAFQATERQFSGLLAAAACGRAITLKLYSLPDVPRAGAAAASLSERYESTDVLRDTHIDGLIVTGTQPCARDLTDEPYWESLARLVDWAEDGTESTLWSCLAAHAAVLRLDGIERETFDRKLSGVFACATSMEHAFASGFPARWHVPHSRYNNLSEDALRACGYRVLSRSSEVGVDLFVKERKKSLFVFCQGHPEYDGDTLMREYRSEIAKFLAGAQDVYPSVPCHYFDADTATALEAFRERAISNRTVDLLASAPFPRTSESRAPHWRSSALRIYKSWVSHLAERRAHRAAAATT